VNQARVFIVLLALISSVAFAAKLSLTISLTQTGMVFQASSGVIRYNVDYAAHTLTLLEVEIPTDAGKLEDKLPLGASLKLAGDDVIIQFPYAFAVSLSPNGRVLTVTRGDLDTAIGPRDPRAPLIIPLAYADPGFVAGFLTRSYSLKVDVDPRQRALIVFVTPEDSALIRGVIADLDQPRPQVAFEANIIEINQQAALSLGIDYQKLLNLQFTEQAPPGVFQLGDISRSAVSLRLLEVINFLKTTNTGRTLARPRITTLDGVEANLQATQTYSIVTTNNGQSSLTSVTTGITMRLLPKISPDQTFIETSLSIAVASPASIQGGTVSYSSRQASTSVRVRNGEPIVIGGLLQDQHSSSSSGLPGLSDIPILGDLFKTTSTVDNYTDLLIVVTPYIIAAPAQTPRP
jgi:general secretion pathway protein D